MTKNDDPLWDPRGGDPNAAGELRELERRLAPHRATPEAPSVEGVEREAAPPFPPTVRLQRRLPLVAAAAAVLALVFSRGQDDGVSDYRLDVLSGTLAASEGRTGPGERIVCDAETRVRLQVGDIGSVEVEPGSALEIVEPSGRSADGARFLLALERGSIAASIFAAPRIFQVATPAGIAVDLGCVYRATVEEDGRTRLSVDSGVVSFETDERRVIVPAGASTWAAPLAGPATPVWDDAQAGWREEVARLDRGEGGWDGLARRLDAEEDEATLVLWHQLSHPNEALRGPAYAALAERVPPPRGVERADCLAAEREALDRWRRQLDWSW